MTDPIQREFERFHELNPSVYVRLVRLARYDLELCQREGRKPRGSISEYFEMIRKSGTHLDNDHRSRYARKIMAQEPDLQDFFLIKGLRAQMQPKVAA